MPLRNLEIKHEYRSFRDDIVKDFYIPALETAVKYKRAVGFFSSSALVEISKGITGLKKNHGKIQIIASPHLSQQDAEAISQGYSDREEVILNSLLNELHVHTDYFEVERLNMLAKLIADDVLDIKIAFTNANNNMGMYHEKMGIIEDIEGNKLAFSGSMNESQTALTLNYETIDVFCGWKNDEKRVNIKEKAFENIWNNLEINVETISFPNLSEEIISKYYTSEPNWNIDKEEYCHRGETLVRSHRNGAYLPSDVELYDYQEKAIEKWKQNSYRGIFDMATGTGKTFTGLGALAQLSKDVNHFLSVFIVCPFQHLVEQWVEDIKKFEINPIIAYSASPQRDWRQRLNNAILDQNLGVEQKHFFCVISTNATFNTDFVQSQISKIKGDALLIVDEAHNFGATYLQKTLSDTFNYRLALSATLERHYDEEGTQVLYDYFGAKSIEYSLDQAIEEKKLTPYRYYPIVVCLDNEENTEYAKLSLEISKCLTTRKDGKISLNERGKMLALKRARLVAGAKNKISALEKHIKPYVDDYHTLVYCGAASHLRPDEDYSEVDSEEERQIDIVTDVLGNQMGMNVSQFTSREDIIEREILKEAFAKGDHLQALIAIKCLDEGVNIPSIMRAFILASTTNPKEYIQRRGRVLRLYPGKEYAEIFDFITLPRPLDEVSSLTEEQMLRELRLVKNELSRGKEFARIALNKLEAENVLNRIKDAYYIEDHQIVFEEDFVL